MAYVFGRNYIGRHVWVTGYNGAVGNTEEDLWDYSAVWTPIAAAGVTLEVASASANDTNASGTGARTVRVGGLSPAGAWIEEDFTLAGQTVQSGTKTFYRVLLVEVLTAGTTGSNEGVIYVADSATAWVAGVPSTTTAIQATVAIGNNRSFLGWFTAGTRAYFLKEMYISNSTQALTVRPKIRYYGDIWKATDYIYVPATTPVVYLDFSKCEERLEIPPLADFRMAVTAAVAGAVSGVTFHLEMV